MSWNLDEQGFKKGDKVYHVVEATVDWEGEPIYEPYSDEFLTVEEWRACNRAIKALEKKKVAGKRARAKASSMLKSIK